MNYSKKIMAMIALVAFLGTACQMQPDRSESVDQLVSTVSHPEWSKNAVMYEVNVRQFTPEGTFNAFAEHMPRLKEMGVDILWFMPITPIGEVERKGTLGSYYSVKDYTGINPEFGTIEDFKNLVNKAHEMGMHVIIDWVANHTAWDHPWTETNPDFYYRDEDGNNTPPYDTDWSDVIQLDYENRELWDAMIGELKFWVEEANVDGFRCDVAYLVPTEFWNKARKELEKVKPIFMLAEADSPELMEHAFNAGYSWTSHHTMNSIARGDQDVSALDNYFFGKPLENEDQQEQEVQAVTYTFDRSVNHYPIGTYKINFIDNHDENSWAGTVRDRLGDGNKAFAVMIFTVNGMPLLYSGQEAGLDKMLEFFEKDEIDWSDMKYEEFYATLISLKHHNKALWNGLAGGPMLRVNTNDDTNVFAFTREKDGDKVFVVLNLSDQARTVDFTSGNYAGDYTELFSGSPASLEAGASLEMDAWGYKVFHN